MQLTFDVSWLNAVVDALNKNQGAIIVLFTGVLVFLNQRLVKETRRIREVGSEPNIEVYLVPHEQSSVFINMVIRNSGGGPARDISWKIDCDKENAERKKIQIFNMTMFNVLHYIPAREEFKFFFASSLDLLADPKMKPINIMVRYKNDNLKNEQKKNFSLILDHGRGCQS